MRRSDNARIKHLLQKDVWWEIGKYSGMNGASLKLYSPNIKLGRRRGRIKSIEIRDIEWDKREKMKNK